MKDYVLDCTFGEQDGLLCFCPVEYGDDGLVSGIITGFSYLSTSVPDGARFVGVVHEDGQDACDEWCATNQAVIDRLLAERESAQPADSEGSQ